MPRPWPQPCTPRPYTVIQPASRYPASTCSIEAHRDAQRRGLAAAGRPDECNNLAVLDRKVDAVERLHMMNLAIHAQGKALGNVEESHLTHSFLQNVPSQWPTTCSAFSRYSGAVTAFRSSGAFKRPAFTI